MTALDDAPAVAAPGRTHDVVRAEKAVLASMISSRRTAEEALDMLGPEDCMGEPLHQVVYAAVRWLTEEAPLREEGTLASGPRGDDGVQRRFTAVLERLVATERGVWKTGEAGTILAALMRHAAPTWRADAGRVLKAAVQRRTVAALDSARLAAARPGFDPFEQGDMIRKLVDDALGGTAPDTGTVTVADLFLETVERMESSTPPGVIQFPWTDLRDLVPWLRPGQLVTFGARPSVGKSVSAADLARHAGIRMRLPVLLVTMEMDRDQVMDRLIAAEAGVPHERITGRTLDDDAWNRISAAQERFAESKIVIDDSSQVTIAHIRARLRGMARTEAAQLVIVDYLQLMAGAQGESRQQEVTALVKGLKAIARDFRIPVVMLCQLNRGPESRQDKRPYMSDARESGSVENDSDVFILIHREDFYDPESPRAGEADLIVDKNRGGRRGTATVGFQGRFQRFVDLAWSPSAVAEDRAS